MLSKQGYKKIEPAAGAVIMANGIFLIGAIETFPVVDLLMGKFLSFILLIVWIIIYSLLTIQFIHRDFFTSFVSNPVQSFTIGTWIAGVSVLCNVLLKYFPKMIFITQPIAVINTFLWLLFLIICFYNFKKLFSDHQDYPVHGVLLLSTVGTQSIIVLLANVFLVFPGLLFESIIILGLIFYVISMILMMNNYLKMTGFILANDWTNTNCIIHGALSITGLAIVSSNTFSASFVMFLWFIILLLIIIVETIEILRGIQRIKLYGWNKGIFQYDVTQWSRNFTFGMFYTFTLFMNNNPDYMTSQQLYGLQQIFMKFWGWVVLLVLLGQISVYIKSRLQTTKRQPEYT